MNAAAPAPEPRTRHKSFTYHTSLEWEENRRGILSSDVKPPMVVTSPPEFKGEAGHWTPEDLLVAAVEACTMTTFLAFSQRLNLGVVSYASRAEGTLEFADGGYRFTRIVLRPVVEVQSPEAVAGIERTLQDAHRSCLISRSIRAEVVLEPEVKVSGTAEPA